jgi:RNA polymerase sigma-70 factor, ECF subfamily
MTFLRPTQSTPTKQALADASAEVIDQLFERAKQGDRAAFGRMTQLLQNKLYNASYRMLGNADDALENVQETFTKALAALSSDTAAHRGQSGAYTWLYRIAVNLVLSKRRQTLSRGKTASLEQSPLDSSSDDQSASLRMKIAGKEASPDELAERNENVRQLRVALSQIAPEHRAVLVMRDIDGMDYQQIADVLGLPLNTLKSRLFRARAELRERLVNQGASKP